MTPGSRPLKRPTPAQSLTVCQQGTPHLTPQRLGPMDLVSGTDGKIRCAWAGIEHDEQYQRYHDTEWGRAVTGEANSLSG